MENPLVENATNVLMQKLGLEARYHRRLIKRVLTDVVQAELLSQMLRDDPLLDEPDAEPTGCCIKIPYFSKSEDAAPLARCIARVGTRLGGNQYLAAVVITEFLQGVAYEVDSGKLVRIPGFGVFGAYAQPHRTTGEPKVWPRFVPARGFRQQVHANCPPEQAQNYLLENYRRSHHTSSRPDKRHGRCDEALIAFRDAVLSQCPEGSNPHELG